MMVEETISDIAIFEESEVEPYTADSEDEIDE